jgi:type IV secretion system protein VirD4
MDSNPCGRREAKAGEAAARERQRQQQEEQQRQREAAARERQRQQQEEQQRQTGAAAQERERRQKEALEILGLKAGATDQEIRAAYKRLITRVHPDTGGSEFFSKQLNAARDVLLGLG